MEATTIQKYIEAAIAEGKAQNVGTDKVHLRMRDRGAAKRHR